MFIKIHGKTHYLWRAVDQDGTVLDILVTSHRDAKAQTSGSWVKIAVEVGQAVLIV